MQLAQVRESVLIISTDPAHNLSDAFRQRFGRHPQKVDGFSNLYALEVDPTPERDVDAAEGQESFLTELASSIPGIDEAMARGPTRACTSALTNARACVPVADGDGARSS